jgi:hypothetical protein
VAERLDPGALGGHDGKENHTQGKRNPAALDDLQQVDTQPRFFLAKRLNPYASLETRRRRRAHRNSFGTALHVQPAMVTPCLMIGSERKRLPVAAKTALTSAGAIGGTPGSPIPPSLSPLWIIETSITGIWPICNIG